MDMFESASDRLDEFRRAIRRESNESEQKRVFDRYKSYILVLIASKDGLLRTVALNSLGEFLVEGLAYDDVWQLIESIAESSNEMLQVEMRIALFEAIVEDPPETRMLRDLFKLIKNPKTQWCLVAAYENSPDKFYRDFKYLTENYQVAGASSPSGNMTPKSSGSAPSSN
jgi:hypothetical protein